MAAAMVKPPTKRDEWFDSRRDEACARPGLEASDVPMQAQPDEPEPSTFGLHDAQVATLAQQPLSAVANLLRTVRECRRRIAERLEVQIDSAAVDEVLGDSLVGIDELASLSVVEDAELMSAGKRHDGRQHRSPDSMLSLSRHPAATRK